MIINGDSREVLKRIKDNSVDLVFSSPPYADIHHYTDNNPKEIGYGQKIDDYINSMAEVFNECGRILKPTGNLWINIMDVMREGRVVRLSEMLIEKMKLPLIERVIWDLRNKMPNIHKHFLANKYEFILHFAKTTDYAFYPEEVRQPLSEWGKKDKRKWKYNPKGSWLGNVWTISATHLPNPVHPAMFPQKLVKRILNGWTQKGDIVMDPFLGSGQCGIVCAEMGREFIGIDVSKKYCKIAQERIRQVERQKRLF